MQFRSGMQSDYLHLSSEWKSTEQQERPVGKKIFFKREDVLGLKIADTVGCLHVNGVAWSAIPFIACPLVSV